MNANGNLGRNRGHRAGVCVDLWHDRFSYKLRDGLQSGFESMVIEKMGHLSLQKQTAAPSMFYG